MVSRTHTPYFPTSLMHMDPLGHMSFESHDIMLGLGASAFFTDIAVETPYFFTDVIAIMETNAEKRVILDENLVVVVFTNKIKNICIHCVNKPS